MIQGENVTPQPRNVVKFCCHRRATECKENGATISESGIEFHSTAVKIKSGKKFNTLTVNKGKV